MLALRSILVVDALDETGLRAARASAADAVAIDLGSTAVAEDRANAHALARRHAREIAAAGVPVFARVLSPIYGVLEEDLDAVVTAGISALILARVEEPQDVRDIDVAARKREMRGHLEPGSIRLITEVASAVGVAALPRIIEAVDRHDAVTVDIGTLRGSLVGTHGPAFLDHAMGEVAMSAHAARLPWVLSGDDGLASRAFEFGAAGVSVRAETAVLGMNTLFAPDPALVEDARTLLDAWERLRARGQLSGVLHGEAGDRHVNRRAARDARALVAMADAIAAREGAR